MPYAYVLFTKIIGDKSDPFFPSFPQIYLRYFPKLTIHSFCYSQIICYLLKLFQSGLEIFDDFGGDDAGFGQVVGIL